MSEILAYSLMCEDLKWSCSTSLSIFYHGNTVFRLSFSSEYLIILFDGLAYIQIDCFNQLSGSVFKGYTIYNYDRLEKYIKTFLKKAFSIVLTKK